MKPFIIGVHIGLWFLSCQLYFFFLFGHVTRINIYFIQWDITTRKTHNGKMNTLIDNDLLCKWGPLGGLLVFGPHLPQCIFKKRRKSSNRKILLVSSTTINNTRTIHNTTTSHMHTINSSKYIKTIPVTNRVYPRTSPFPPPAPPVTTPPWLSPVGKCIRYWRRVDTDVTLERVDWESDKDVGCREREVERIVWCCRMGEVMATGIVQYITKHRSWPTGSQTVYERGRRRKGW